MKRQVINGDMKIWDVIQDHPETHGVFRQFGCPDIRKKTFAISSHFMKLSAAAQTYHIDLNELHKLLDKAVADHGENISATRHQASNLSRIYDRKENYKNRGQIDRSVPSSLPNQFKFEVLLGPGPPRDV